MAEELETKVEETVVAENTESTENKRENNILIQQLIYIK